MAKKCEIWPKGLFFMPQLKNKVDDLYQFHLFFKEGIVISNLIVFQEAVVISSYLDFNKTWKKCHFPIKAHDKTAFFGNLNVIVWTAKTRSMTYWFFCLISVRRWYTLQRSDLYTSVVIHKWDQLTSLTSVRNELRKGEKRKKKENTKPLTQIAKTLCLLYEHIIRNKHCFLIYLI